MNYDRFSVLECFCLWTEIHLILNLKAGVHIEECSLDKKLRVERFIKHEDYNFYIFHLASFFLLMCQLNIPQTIYATTQML